MIWFLSSQNFFLILAKKKNYAMKGNTHFCHLNSVKPLLYNRNSKTDYNVEFYTGSTVLGIASNITPIAPVSEKLIVTTEDKSTLH